MEENPALDLYILAQTPSHNPKVCFVPTASGDSDDHIARFYSAYERLPCEPSHLTFSGGLSQTSGPSCSKRTSSTWEEETRRACWPSGETGAWIRHFGKRGNPVLSSPA